MFNVIRTPKAPASLKSLSGWNNLDVLTELRLIFHNKCYLCEIKDTLDINVEHLASHQKDKIKQHDWDNLFYACGRCNKIKSTKYDDIIDCAKLEEKAYKLIKHLPPRTPYEKKIPIVAMQKGTQIDNTVELLNKIFNANNTIIQNLTAESLRNIIFEKCNRFLAHAIIYFDEESTSIEKKNSFDKMVVFTSKIHEFSIFTRWLILEDTRLQPLLEKHFD